MRRLILLAVVLALTTPGLGAQAAKKAPVQIPKVEFPTDSLGRIIFHREVFAYPRSGRRDPFASLIATGEIRPLFEDLRLTGIIEDVNPRNSMAMMKDISTNELYRIKVGSVFGRMRVTHIRAGEVGLAIDEFGFTREEVLKFNVPSGGRTP